MSNSLLQRVASGDLAATQECIETYGGLVWSLARRFCPSATEAEDAVQEVFIALWENAARFDESIGAEVTFVAMIARRRLIDRARKHERRQRLLADARTESEGRSPETRDDVSTVDEARRAGEALQQLSENQQRVLSLAIHRGLTHEQISEHTGMPLGTVKTHARRGLMRIRDLLAPSSSPPSMEPSA